MLKITNYKDPNANVKGDFVSNSFYLIDRDGEALTIRDEIFLGIKKLLLSSKNVESIIFNAIFGKACSIEGYENGKLVSLSNNYNIELVNKINLLLLQQGYNENSLNDIQNNYYNNIFEIFDRLNKINHSFYDYENQNFDQYVKMVDEILKDYSVIKQSKISK